MLSRRGAPAGDPAASGDCAGRRPRASAGTAGGGHRGGRGRGSLTDAGGVRGAHVLRRGGEASGDLDVAWHAPGPDGRPLHLLYLRHLLYRDISLPTASPPLPERPGCWTVASRALTWTCGGSDAVAAGRVQGLHPAGTRRPRRRAGVRRVPAGRRRLRAADRQDMRSGSLRRLCPRPATGDERPDTVHGPPRAGDGFEHDDGAPERVGDSLAVSSPAGASVREPAAGVTRPQPFRGAPTSVSRPEPGPGAPPGTPAARVGSVQVRGDTHGVVVGGEAGRMPPLARCRSGTAARSILCRTGTSRWGGCRGPRGRRSACAAASGSAVGGMQGAHRPPGAG